MLGGAFRRLPETGRSGPDGKGIFLARFRLGKLDKPPIRQRINGIFPSLSRPQANPFPYGIARNGGFTKGVVSVPNTLLIGFDLSPGNPPL